MLRKTRNDRKMSVKSMIFAYNNQFFKVNNLFFGYLFEIKIFYIQLIILVLQYILVNF